MANVWKSGIDYSAVSTTHES
ncbi:uncharacterized protein G2W53_006402 [Senna tora]|uniref:Uncharacterized protein n=1 Tax=Senna tora TaxID=362788 RepID=A0A834X4Q7_9FABA|nr:uncharacterized protein G2W53_006402 [Senna tora]